MRLRAHALLAVILAFCLVLSQHGALVHAFVHLDDVDGHAREAQVDTWHALDGQCETCLAYAACAAAPPIVAWLRVASGDDDVLAAPPRVVPASASAGYAARAPPLSV